MPPGYAHLRMGWVDSHCHLQLDARPPAELLARAGNVDWVVVPGIDADSSDAALALAAFDPQRIVATAGLHPHEAERWPFERDRIAEMARRAVAVGETGLDFYRNLSEPERQIESFTGQIELAAGLGKPLVVHCRDAFESVHDLLDRFGAGPQTVLHCWTGGPRWTRRFLDLGCWFSFAGPVAFTTGETVRLGAALVPPNRAMVETDTPYLTPPPHRSELNEPAFVELVGAALAGVWSLDVEVVAQVTASNAAKVFKR